jgi:maltose/moltooligosaccharide transporter
MVNEEQKAKAYSIQSFLCNAGSVVGFMFPYVFTWIGIQNVAEKGVVPDSVIWSFYIGAAILILCVIYTTMKVREWPPEEYAEYNPVTNADEGSANWFTLLKHAPLTFWKVGVVQFFCWAGMLYMWTYVVDAVSETVWGTIDPTTSDYQEAANWTGVLYAIQALGSVVWAALLSRTKNPKLAYAVSLVLGGAGFLLIPFIPDMYGQILPFLLIGCGWAAMLSMPFTFVTNALQGYGHMGAYLGLFNGTICVPQIVAALCGGSILSAIGGAPSSMMLVAGNSFAVGAVAVSLINKNK